MPTPRTVTEPLKLCLTLSIYAVVKDNTTLNIDLHVLILTPITPTVLKYVIEIFLSYYIVSSFSGIRLYHLSFSFLFLLGFQ